MPAANPDRQGCGSVNCYYCGYVPRPEGEHREAQRRREDEAERERLRSLSDEELSRELFEAAQQNRGTIAEAIILDDISPVINEGEEVPSLTFETFRNAFNSLRNRERANDSVDVGRWWWNVIASQRRSNPESLRDIAYRRGWSVQANPPRDDCRTIRAKRLP